ncbi:hypothetical protein R3P38DRAFT_3177872 [Favolaschia claudopus]|uniref:Uncharacterized protein n=1 Tax=Favolaschia claudopus TaxID=2862362 RepID=A0AAW0CUD5_9AGAR
MAADIVIDYVYICRGNSLPNYLLLWLAALRVNTSHLDISDDDDDEEIPELLAPEEDDQYCPCCLAHLVKSKL